MRNGLKRIISAFMALIMILTGSVVTMPASAASKTKGLDRYYSYEGDINPDDYGAYLDFFHAVIKEDYNAEVEADEYGLSDYQLIQYGKDYEHYYEPDRSYTTTWDEFCEFLYDDYFYWTGTSYENVLNIFSECDKGILIHYDTPIAGYKSDGSVILVYRYWDKQYDDLLGYDKDGLNNHGYDYQGFDKDGYNAKGYHKDTLDKDGNPVMDGYNKKEKVIYYFSKPKKKTYKGVAATGITFMDGNEDYYKVTITGLKKAKYVTYSNTYDIEAIELEFDGKRDYPDVDSSVPVSKGKAVFYTQAKFDTKKELSNITWSYYKGEYDYNINDKKVSEKNVKVTITPVTESKLKKECKITADKKELNVKSNGKASVTIKMKEPIMVWIEQSNPNVPIRYGAGGCPENVRKRMLLYGSWGESPNLKQAITSKGMTLTFFGEASGVYNLAYTEADLRKEGVKDPKKWVEEHMQTMTLTVIGLYSRKKVTVEVKWIPVLLEKYY